MSEQLPLTGLQPDYNAKYRFISDGTWFKAGTECIVEDGSCLWFIDVADNGDPNEIPYEALVANRHRISGLFRGTRISEGFAFEAVEAGVEYEDGELCVLDEFEIVKRT